MKTEEQLLLNYMYQKGYTGDEMFDEQKLVNVRNSLEYSIHRFKLAIPKIVEAYKVFANNFLEMWTGVVERVQDMWPVIKEISFIEPPLPQQKTFVPIDFSFRPLIQHQVINRKPKHLVRKIIH